MVQVVRNIIFQRKFNGKASWNGGLRLESLVVDLGINMLWPQAGRDCRPYSCRKTVTMCAARAKCGSNVAQKMARWALVKAWIAQRWDAMYSNISNDQSPINTPVLSNLFRFLPKNRRSSKTAISALPQAVGCSFWFKISGSGHVASATRTGAMATMVSWAWGDVHAGWTLKMTLENSSKTVCESNVKHSALRNGYQKWLVVIFEYVGHTSRRENFSMTQELDRLYTWLYYYLKLHLYYIYLYYYITFMLHLYYISTYLY